MPIAPNNPVYTLERFKNRYLELVGEKIQDHPNVNRQNTHYLVGSSRLTQGMANQLAAEFPMVTVTNQWPAAWQPEDEGVMT
jgi:hypothetical protein